MRPRKTDTMRHTKYGAWVDVRPVLPRPRHVQSFASRIAPALFPDDPRPRLECHFESGATIGRSK
jgi:hypothetical protein